MIKRCLAVFAGSLLLSTSFAQGTDPGAPENAVRGTFRGVSPVVRFDVSPPLKDLPLNLVFPDSLKPQRAKEDSASGLEWLSQPPIQMPDARVQPQRAPLAMPPTTVNFDALNNLAGVNPPDPVGDIGPNHYVAMANVSFQIFDRNGTSLRAASNINSLWAGFGGACQTENAGDPIVVHDQFADRWILTQFTAAGPTFFNCIAISTTPDPLGTYYRYAVSTGTNFPDYPKYGVWRDAYVITTREFAGGAFAGVGVYGLSRAQLIAGNPTPTIVQFLIAPGATPYNVGDGLLPADIDGSTLPPAGAPAYLVGSMDLGGPYSAPQDALTLWKFVTDFTTPANSSITLANTLNVATFDSIYPCSGRQCLPQAGSTSRLDILSYRQRALNRLAYRNLGTHESLVTNQSVEAAANMAGIRWWEIRSPNSSPVVFQEGTFAPGVTDGVHRWMASIAQDSAGNMAMGYSATSPTIFPGIRYTGRLASDPAGQMSQGEGTIINGLGALTAGGNRWGDYTSINLDPVDDCTFWFINQYMPSTSASGWRLRVGAFRFDQCGAPSFSLNSSSASRAVCSGSSTDFELNLRSIAGFNASTALTSTGTPAGVTVNFSPNPVVALPGVSTASVVVPSTLAAGSYGFTVTGTSGAIVSSTQLNLTVQSAMPSAPVLTAPANASGNVGTRPTFTWNASTQAVDYVLQIATDAAFSNIISQTITTATTVTLSSDLPTNTQFFWRVSARNACRSANTSGDFKDGFEDRQPEGVPSASQSFTTAPGPADCAIGMPTTVYSETMENGAPGWTNNNGTIWSISNGFPFAGTNAYRGVAPITASVSFADMPPVTIPTGVASASLAFQNRPALEPSAAGCFDGGHIQVSTDGGATYANVTAGITGLPYRGATPSLGAGVSGWCGATAYTLTGVSLTPYIGQTVRLRFRLGSDTSENDPAGWNIDDVRVLTCPSN